MPEMPTAQIIRDRIEKIPDITSRLALMYQYLICGRVSEVAGEYRPLGSHAQLMDFDGEEALLFPVRTAKREGRLRPAALPLNPKYEPWTEELLDWFSDKGATPAFPTTPRTLHRRARRAFKGLSYPIEIIHHDFGQHTFVAARDYHNREVFLMNQPHEEITKPHFVGDNFHLGTPIIDSLGRLKLDGYSKEMMKLKNETRRILLLALRNARSPNGYVDLDKVVNQSARSRQTVRKHLNVCLNLGLLRKYWSRGEYKVDYDNVA